MQEWRDIPGYEGVYQASSDGEVRSCDRIITETTLNGVVVEQKIREGHTLKQSFDKRGEYLKVGLYTFGRVDVQPVHRLVAMSFLGTAPEGWDVHHIDWNSRNNNIENLQWVRREEHLQIHDHKHFKR